MTEPTSNSSAEKIRAALQQGRKIEAIKLYREQSGAELKEAKEAVEQLEADLRTAEPEKFSTKKTGGCSAAVLVAVVAVAALGFWISRL